MSVVCEAFRAEVSSPSECRIWKQMLNVKRGEEHEAGGCVLEKLIGANGQLKYKMENNMCNKVKSSGSSESLEEDDPLLEKST